MLLNSPNGGVVIHTAEEVAYVRHQDDRRTNPEQTVELPASYRGRAFKHPHELALATDNSVTALFLQPRTIQSMHVLSWRRGTSVSPGFHQERSTKSKDKMRGQYRIPDGEAAAKHHVTFAATTRETT